MEMNWRLVAATGLALCACGPKKTGDGGGGNVGVCVDVHAGGGDKNCGPLGCGPNSPIANTFPINGLTNDRDGACNQELAQLMPQSVSGKGEKCDGADLMFDATNNVLVAKKGDKVVCAGQGLVGIKFKVRGPTGTVELKIKKVRPTKVAMDETSFEGYRIVYKGKDSEDGDDSPKGSTCDPEVAAAVRADLGLKKLPTYGSPKIPTPKPGPNSELVIGVNEPIYTIENQPYETKAHMFNLACADDALGKRSTYKLITDDVQKNTNSLRMLTATYCRKPYTVPGMDIAWLRAQMPHDKVHEASWNGGATMCLDTPRLTFLKDVDNNPIQPDNFPDELKPPGCDNGQKCTIDDWKANVLKECGSGDGSGSDTQPPTPMSACNDADTADLESYTFIKGNQATFKRKTDTAISTPTNQAPAK